MYHCSNSLLCQKLKSRVSFIQLKSILDIFLRGFTLSTQPGNLFDLILIALKSHVSFKVCNQL
jgi:hypothetical protein